MFQVRNVNGSAPFPEDRGWKDTVWVDGQVELLVYYAQPSWPHFPFQFLSQTLELADRGSIGQMLVNPGTVMPHTLTESRSGYKKISLHFHHRSGL
jgi:suppressor of ftsI